MAQTGHPSVSERGLENWKMNCGQAGLVLSLI